ncbi:putative sensory transducer protein YfmS [bioreactor metagenome]|uniref:Putative sensory transducer protein YfmS n=1 Tax=bioreactor metagenome TaxID=1076179 RepID=A0A644XFG7_9ZZZZ
MPDVFYCFKQIAPYLNNLTINDTAVYLADRENYLLAFPGENIMLPIKPGDKIQRGTAVRECIAKNKAVRLKVPENVLGTAYIACAVPISEDNKVVGGVSFVTSIKQEEKLLGIAAELSKGLEKVISSSKAIEDQAESMINIYEELFKLSETLHGCIRETDDVLKVIDNFAMQTNLLGINASVEAARAGSAGKGFGVIAKETSRLANSTSSSSKKIEEIFDRIKAASGDQASVIDNINHIVFSQREAVKNVNAEINMLSVTLETLMKDAQKLNNNDY